MNKLKENLSIDLIFVMMTNLLLSSNILGFIGLITILNVIRDLFDITLYLSFIIFIIIYFFIKSSLLPILYSMIISRKPKLNVAESILKMKTDKRFRHNVLKYSFIADIICIFVIAIIYTIFCVIQGTTGNWDNPLICFGQYLLFASICFILFGGGLGVCYLILFKYWKITKQIPIEK